MTVYAELISIGDEILYGQTLDTNSHWISARLDEIGIKVKRKITIGDQRDEILSSLKDAESRADIILVTGGLGPTKDDLTKPLLVEFFNTHLVLDKTVEKHIEALFAQRGRDMTPLNRKQAEIPANCTRIDNKMGTAPGMWFDKEGKILVSMPGVPYEMKTMMEDFILPRLKKKFLGGVIYHKIIKTIGIPESTLSEIISDWEDQLPHHIRLAYLPSAGQVKLRLTAVGTNRNVLEREVQEHVSQVLRLIQKYVYGYDADEIEKVIGDMLLKEGKTLGFAESCTGGYLSHLITSIPGSSRYFKGSIVSYDNSIKTESLEVDAKTIEEKGAVSEDVVIQMAENVRKKLGTDVGISVSGIAGPDGGTDEKPVGTVWIAYADAEKTITKKFTFSKDRKLNIHFSALSALNMFRLNFNSK